MKDTYKYYIKIIKPIEKKYTKMCILYLIFKLEFFRKKRDFYNKILINYYKVLKNDSNTIKEIEKHFKSN